MIKLTCPDQIQMEIPDVMSWLIEYGEKCDKGRRNAEQAILQCDSRLIVVAGRRVKPVIL